MSQNEITEIRIYSIEDFVKSLHQYTSTIKSPIWFRGCTNIDYYLIPSLYRKINKLNSFQINDKERQVFSFFRERSIPYHNYSLTNSWHTYFLMQHNGIPTRLLDWTENAFVGLYFALMNPRNYIDKLKMMRLFGSSCLKNGTNML